MPFLTRSLMLALLLSWGCGSGGAPVGEACQSGATACFEDPSVLLVCEDGRWAAQECPAEKICHESRCQALACVPGMKACRDGGISSCSADGSGWLAAQRCSGEEACDAGACRPVICQSGVFRCSDGGRERCNAPGTRWEPWTACDDGAACVDGACLADSCSAGDLECGPTTLYSCDAGGNWQALPCPEGQPCLFGRCLECVVRADCGAGETCEGGACVVTRPAITTGELPPSTVNVNYSEKIEVSGGLEPYVFEISSGELPAGLTLSADGRISGRPTTSATNTFTVKVTDARDATASKTLVLDVLAAGELRLITTSIPNAELDYAYSFELKASGGVPPYAWQALSPLPDGLSLTSGGKIQGTPTVLGDFPITFRVLDVRTPPGYDARDFNVKVVIAPLEILGEEAINLLGYKILTLPLLVEHIPYSTQLTARGGLRPYTWAEEPLPSWLRSLTGGGGGLPPELTLSSGGKLSGRVTDASDAVTIGGSWGLPKLTGYFFQAKVQDSQNPAESKTALYLIPTVPLN